MKSALEIAGDIWHAPAVIHRAIGAKLQDKGWKVDKVYDYNVPFEQLMQYDLIILSRYALDDTKNNEIEKHLWITPQQEKMIEQYVFQGGSILLHHDGISHYPKSGGISTVAKAFRINHPPMGSITLIPSSNESNGFTDGIESFVLEDEEFNIEIEEKDVTVFLTSISQRYGRHLQGWYHRHGKGKVVVFIPGHEDTVLKNPMICRLMNNILEWLTNDSI